VLSHATVAASGWPPLEGLPADARQATVDLKRLASTDRGGPWVWLEGDPVPVVQSTEALDGEPRVTYRLDPGELDRLRAVLDQAGLAEATLVPRRSRVRAGR
jgi:hypothetical protein